MNLNKNFPYYVLRFLQRISLLLVLLATVIYWVILIIIVALGGYESAQVHPVQLHGNELNATWQRAVNMQTTNAIKFAVVSLLLTALMFLVLRVRKEDKKIIIDSLAVLVFCLLSVLFAQILVHSFVIQLAG